MLCAVTLLAAAAASPGPVDAATLAERRPALEARFARMDRNRDGFVASNEAPRASQARCGDGGETPGWVERFDADGDGRVSADEFVLRSAARDTRSQLAARPD